MARPVTLFTGQWADLPFEEVAAWRASGATTAWRSPAGATTSTSVGRGEDDAYVRGRLDILDKHDLKVWAISNHLTGQAVCDDPIDERHQGILSARHLG